jgi:hypothetical protein
MEDSEKQLRGCLLTAAFKPPFTGLTTVKTVKFTKKAGSCHQTTRSTFK